MDLDASVHRMIALLKDRPAIYFYCSDHGVALGEEGKMFQGHVLPPVYRPAMFVWYSDAFASRYPDMVRALKANRLKAVSHDHIFHTLLSLASIRSEVVRNGLNLASPAGSAGGMAGRSRTAAAASVKKMEAAVILCGERQDRTNSTVPGLAGDA